MWFNKKVEATKAAAPSSTSIAQLERFLSEYDRAGKSRTRYAMALWGIHAAFVKIFGGLDEYQRDDPAKKNRYIRMIANNAITAMNEDNEFAAKANQAFVNFLIATEGLPRRQLRGAIENAADRIDGIVRFGQAEIDRVGLMENAAKEFLAKDAEYSIGTGTVQGAVTERNVIAASQIIINELQKVLSSHEDYHRYIIEQYARLRLEPGIRTLLDGVPLFEIELSVLGPNWSKNSPPGIGVACIDALRPQVRRWCQLTVPSMDAGELSLRVIGAAYGHFRNTGEAHFNQIRAGYAKIFRDQCLQSGFPAEASKWGEVVKKLAA